MELEKAATGRPRNRPKSPSSPRGFHRHPAAVLGGQDGVPVVQCDLEAGRPIAAGRSSSTVQLPYRYEPVFRLVPLVLRGVPPSKRGRAHPSHGWGRRFNPCIAHHPSS